MAGGILSNGQAAETIETRKGRFGIRCISRRERTRFLAMHKEAGEDLAKRDEAVAYLVGSSLLGSDHARVFPAGDEPQALDIDADLFEVFAEAAMRLNLPGPEPEGKAGSATPIAPSQPSSP